MQLCLAAHLEVGLQLPSTERLARVHGLQMVCMPLPPVREVLPQGLHQMVADTQDTGGRPQHNTQLRKAGGNHSENR